ncbi:hypothetical protein OG889_11460 [Streptomyces sp. NBC_00481]|uniref:hypothetical protein n=1 Tax=unclassified Streptomyces TaxID=2593676 RepID=UPI002DDC2E6B|nr:MULTISPECIES: hypothetical protein [unclassified Streptomyces]WRY95295.1 hypothetical protein OG889_11460 [Streptomyces sp. NBC_00481]
MVRVSYDYDLMTVLARHLWHLRDELDVTSQTDKTFTAGDIGPRRETTEALEDFYGAWKKSFREGWQVMTDLGNLLDKAGKAFYDQDASQAAGAAQQVTAQVRGEAVRHNEMRKQKLNGKLRADQARRLEAGYRTQQARLKKEQDALVEKRRKFDEQTAAQQKRQEELNREQEELARKREPLLKQQDELQARQQRLWQEEKELLKQREEKLQVKRDELQKEYEALREEQEPLLKRQEELQLRQQQLWADEKALRAEQDAAMEKKVTALEQEQKAYDAKQDGLRERQEALYRERETLLGKGNATQADLDAWQRKQDALGKERDALWESEGKGLAERWDALEQEQRDQEKAFDPFRERQRELDGERDALSRAQEPLTERQDGLQARQKDLWALEKSTQQEVEDAVKGKRDSLDAERADLQTRLDPLDQESKDLQDRQKDLWDDQSDDEDTQTALTEEEKALQQRQQDLQDGFGEEYDKLREWDPDRDPDVGRLRGMRGQLDDLPPEAFVPKGYTVEDANSTTTVSYQLDENGEIKVDKNGDPVETTTTVTNKNTGLSYSETYHALAEDGDSVSTIRSSDGSVTKIYTDSSPEGEADGTMRRYVTDETGRDTLQIWTKRPGGDWELTLDKETYLNSDAGQEDAQQRLDRPPAYLTVENPLVDGDGRPSAPASEGTTTQVQEGVTRTNYTGSDGAVTKVVTNENTGTRFVAGANDEIQEIWQRRGDGTWYLRESVTQHERYGDEPPLGTLGENWR